MRLLLKKFVFIFLSFWLLAISNLTLITPKAHAQSTWYNQSFTDWYSKVYGSPQNEIFGERYTTAQVQWIYMGLISQVINIAVLGNTEVVVCMINGPTDCIGSAIQSGLQNIVEFFMPQDVSPTSDKTVGFSKIIASNPVSGVNYIRKMFERINPVSKVHAQGMGFSATNSVQEIWRVSRNISYFFLVIAVIVISFMIMFRVKINPQVIISIQSALPKIIISLVLITFSYAIAGLLIDTMYIVIGIIALFLSQSGMTTEDAKNLFLEFTTKHNAISLLFEYWFMFVTVSMTTIVSSWNPATWVGGLLLSLFAIIAILAMIWYSIKLIIIMFKNFVLILLTIIVGPLEIMLGTLTGSSGFGSWFKKLVSYLAVYPLWAIMFFLAFFFLGQAVPAWFPDINQLNMFPFNIKLGFITANAWDPPLSTWVVTGQNLIWAIVSFVIITMTPKVTEIIQSAIQNKPFAYGTGMGEVANAGRFVGTAAETASRSSSFMAGAGKTTSAIVNALKWLAFLPK